MAKFLSTIRDIPAYSLAQLFPNNTNMDRFTWVRQTGLDSPTNSANTPVEALYGDSTNAINTANYNDFPIGSEITDPYGSTKKKYLKTATTTWLALSYS